MRQCHRRLGHATLKSPSQSGALNLHTCEHGLQNYKMTFCLFFCHNEVWHCGTKPGLLFCYPWEGFAKKCAAFERQMLPRGEIHHVTKDVALQIMKVALLLWVSFEGALRLSQQAVSGGSICGSRQLRDNKEAVFLFLQKKNYWFNVGRCWTNLVTCVPTRLRWSSCRRPWGPVCLDCRWN